MNDSVEHHRHYVVGGLEVIDAIEAWELGFHLGNVIKYVVRSPRKGNELEDLKKARWYLDRYISRLQRAADHELEPEAKCPAVLGCVDHSEFTCDLPLGHEGQHHSLADREW